jgi:hypothetical protein
LIIIVGKKNWFPKRISNNYRELPNSVLLELNKVREGKKNSKGG